MILLGGGIRPHIFTFFLWSVTSTIIFLLQLEAGGGIGAWVTFFIAFLIFIVFLSSFKNGRRDIKPIDFVFLFTALGTLPVWLIAEQSVLSVVLLTFINMVGFVPAIRKSWNDPLSEKRSLYGVNVVRYLLAIAALASFNFITLLPHVSAMVANMIFFIILYLRHRQLKDI